MNVLGRDVALEAETCRQWGRAVAVGVWSRAWEDGGGGVGGAEQQAPYPLIWSQTGQVCPVCPGTPEHPGCLALSSPALTLEGLALLCSMPASTSLS